MNRRGFFKSLGIATAAVVIAPQLLIPKEVPIHIPEYPKHLGGGLYTYEVKVGTRKINCECTQEMVADLKRMKGIEDIEKELYEYMSSLKFEYR